MVLTATSSYTLSDQISIFRRFHQSYKAQKAKRVLLSQEGFSRSSPLFYFCLTFRVLENSREMDGYARCRRIPAVFHIKSHSAEHAQTKCLYAKYTVIINSINSTRREKTFPASVGDMHARLEYGLSTKLVCSI